MIHFHIKKADPIPRYNPGEEDFANWWEEQRQESYDNSMKIKNDFLEDFRSRYGGG